MWIPMHQIYAFIWFAHEKIIRIQIFIGMWPSQSNKMVDILKSVLH
jgi:hypothetical protein